MPPPQPVSELEVLPSDPFSHACLLISSEWEHVKPSKSEHVEDSGNERIIYYCQRLSMEGEANDTSGMETSISSSAVNVER